MKVLIPGGEVFDLGTTATTPTVGVIDYSRRVTDDYGVTTVVERGFARRMSVRLGVPTELVDAVQRKLAALRATTAQWVANDAYACLSVNGFLKDFDLDLSVPPLSYCTLTVEGLTETEPFLDAGGDPAPFGQSSTLRLLQPAPISDAALVSSNVPETDYPAWAAATTYAIGARVIKTDTHRIYESAVAGNVGDDPAAAMGKWLDVGSTNRWAMFDQALGSATTASASMAVTLTAASIGAVALLDVVGVSVRVQATGYDRTQPVGAGAMTFLDLPTNTTRVTVTLAGSGTVSIGTLLVGKLVGLGVTEASPTAGITDYSRKDVDDFGAVTIVERAWAKRMTANALISTSAIDSVFSRIAKVRATPALWIGQAGYDSLTIYGFFKEFAIEAGDAVSKLSLSIEGLSTAGKVEPFAPGTGGSVDWPNVGDPDGTKPANNADVTGQNTSKDTNAVGGKPSAEFLAELATYQAQLAYIDGTTIPTINQAVIAANNRIAEARAAADAAVAAARKSADDAVAAANVKITTARGDLDRALLDLAAEVARAKGEDEDLAQRIDSISAGSGYDDTQVRALIQTVDTARADDQRAIANRVDTIVTDYQSRDSATNARVTQNITTFSNADMALTSRIDSAISEYKGLDTNTNARVTSNIAILADADRALGQRIDALVVEGGGYDDSYVRAEITTNSFASIDRDSALGQRIDTVSASFSRGGGNLLSNTDFTTLDGWVMGATLPGGSPISLNQAGTAWMVGGIENNLSVYQAGRAAGGDNAVIQLNSEPFGVTPGSFIQFYAFSASHRATNWTSLYFYDDAGAFVGYAGENFGARMGNGGHNAADWEQVGVKSIRVPDAARTARMILRKYNTIDGQANSYAWWWRPYVGEAREGQSVWNAFTSGNSKAVQVRADAQISQVQTVAATATQSIANLSTSVTAQFGGVNQTLSAYDARITTLSTDLQSTALQVSTLSAGFSRGGGNALSNTDFVTTDGWVFGSNSPNGPMVLTPGVDSAGAEYHPVGEHVISMFQGAPVGGGAYCEWASEPFGVTPGEYVQYFTFYNSHRADTMIGVIWLNQTGSPLSANDSGRKPALGVLGNNPANLVQIGAKSVLVPANAVAARVILRKFDTNAGASDSYGWFWRPYVGSAKQGQNVWNDYAAGNGRAVQQRADAAVTQASTAAASAVQSVADLTTSVNSRFGGVSQTLANYDSRITAVASDTQGYVGRTSTLEAQMAGNTPSVLLQYTTNVRDVAFGRLTTAENVIADLPNRYAVVSRTATLEAQVQGTAGSNLLARANDQTAAIVDAKVGAITQTVSTLRSEYNGTAATVQQQAGTLAAIDGRSSIYWSVTGTTPDGSTSIQLSKADGSPGLFYVNANMLIEGNLLVTGSVNTGEIAPNAVTQWAAITNGSGVVEGGGGPVTSGSASLTTQGGLIKIDCSFDATSTAGTGASFYYQLFRDSQPITRKFNVLTTTISGYVNLSVTTDMPSAGLHRYNIEIGRLQAGTSELQVTSIAVFVQEFKR